MEILRKRNEATVIYFPMIKAGSQDFAINTDWTPASGDCQYSVDGGAFANTTNLPTHEGNGSWSLSLVAGEVNGKVTAITIVDSATKAVEDQALYISTYGDGSAQHLLNLIADYVLKRNMATSRASSDGDGSGRFILQAFSRLRNKVYQSGSNLIITEEDDSTQDWQAALTTSEGADPITAIDPT